jgi:tetratricopeptide (TPR) repeat protein
MRILITGGAGFIASHLADSLLEDGFDVVGIDNFNTFYDPALKKNRVEYFGHQVYECDLKDFDELDLALMPGAFAAFKLGKYDEVIDYTSEVIKKFPDSDYVAEAHRLRGMVYRIKGNEKQAEDDFNKAIAMCSDQIKSPGSPADIPGAYYERGLDYYNLGEYQKAANDFQYLINHPEVSDREVAHENYFLESHVALASVYSKLGKNDEAVRLLQETLNILSTDPELQGWNKYVRNDIEKLLGSVEANKTLNMPIGLCQFLGK